jgi:ABC-type phosphate transport system auxiliary subunit
MYVAFKGILGFWGIKEGIIKIPELYTEYNSTINIADSRKKQIEERRGRLKVEKDDPRILQIVIIEMLKYKPSSFRLHDRYLELEKVLDAIDDARVNKETHELIKTCEEIANNLKKSPGPFNRLLIHLNNINSQIQALQKGQAQLPRAKL